MSVDGTPDHLTADLKMFSEVFVGDIVSGLKVVDIVEILNSGLVTPITRSGTVNVNGGFVVSSYSNYAPLNKFGIR